MRVAGLSGLTAATMSVAGGVPLSALAASAADDTPEAFLASAYATRAQAMSTGDVSKLAALYDPASSTLLAYENERAKYFKNGLGARWAHSPVLGYTSTVKLLGLTVSGATATARLYESVAMEWIPPAPVGEYRLPRGKHGELTTGFGNRHEVTLHKETGGWRIVKDAYDEYGLFTPSPNLVRGSWAEIQKGGTRGTPIAPPPAGPATVQSYTYNRTLALQCAGANNTACNTPYNSQYCSYVGCGGDCANYVSQCFRAGGMPPDYTVFHSPIDGGGGTWDTPYSGCGAGSPPACGYATYGGTDTWANNEYLRDWLNTTGRGQSKGGLIDLVAGDIINYAWHNACSGWTSYDDDRVDHVVIVTEKNNGGNGALISCHDRDICNGWWDFDSGCGCKFHTYSHVVDYFPY